MRFLELIFLELNVPQYKFVRINQEEVYVAGNEGQACDMWPLSVWCILWATLQGDLQIINSYPSKIGTYALNQQ